MAYWELRKIPLQVAYAVLTSSFLSFLERRRRYGLMVFT